MSMRRPELHDLLQLLEAAVSKKEFTPIFSCYCFDGENVHAYDGVVGIQRPCELPITGGVRADQLSKWLAASASSGEVGVEQDGENVTFKLGRSKYTTAAIDAEQYEFDITEFKGIWSVVLEDELLAAMRQCLVSMGDSPQAPELSGMVLDFGAKDTKVYSQNGRTATRVVMPPNARLKGKRRTITLPPRVGDLLVTVGSREPKTRLLFNKECMLAKCPSGMLVYSSTSTPEGLSSYETLFKSNKSAGAINIPKTLESLLKQADAVSMGEDLWVELKVAKDRLHIKAEDITGSTSSRVMGSAKLSSPHQECSVWCKPTDLRRCIDGADKMLLVPDQCVLLSGDGVIRKLAIKAVE